MTINKSLQTLRRVLPACLALPLFAAPAYAGTAGGAAAPVLGQWNIWFWMSYLSNVGSRGNVVMVCIVIFCISLVILMSATRRS